MNFATPLTATADPTRRMPASPGARLDAADAAVASLREEQRRLERLGFELPLARCHQQLRYWNFVRALHALPREARS
ncbi:MAG: hypothetical protein U0704_01535 [Candidatus Eisenbacteria bacterium]